ncbi:hypothetical protein GCM10007415_09380 [Parapedobacter pyrenivorans]|uniref:Uncharacterized protein n=1 Tax=Parapedobacter pyrenivorans TaxID=1305674 RepID=A0A917HGX7_9SPHI|nr:hypothetical protein [Parapedobacter pyrenivorans]GGG79309.1 hypothetical protein GCM10007415_09380 [Parapedobacter pyrenivorans]
MDLPPWDERAGTRVWANMVELPDSHSFRYVALMMNRFNYPGLKGRIGPPAPYTSIMGIPADNFHITNENLANNP